MFCVQKKIPSQLRSGISYTKLHCFQTTVWNLMQIHYSTNGRKIKGEIWIMKRTKEEYICDFCGRECTEEHYDTVLPIEIKKKSLIRTTRYNVNYISQHFDLCSECTKKLSNMHEVIKNICASTNVTVNDDRTITITRNK